jgi:hypothetical protein
VSQGAPLTAPLLVPTPLASPVVGEFKGWFSNLFHWKQQHVLYSSSDIASTRDEAARLLEQCGVGLVGEDIGGRLVLRCCLDDAHAQAQRGVRFRIEFSALGAAQAAAGSFHPMTPASPPPLGSRKSWKQGTAYGGTGFQCMIAFVQEKGSVATLRAIYQHIRAEWRLDGLQSPSMPPTPHTPMQRFAVA